MDQKYLLTIAIFASLILMATGFWFEHLDVALGGAILMAASSYVLGGDSND